MTPSELNLICALRNELRETRNRLARYDGFLSRLLCSTCAGDREVSLSHEPCNTDTVPCPKCCPEERR